VAAHDIRRVEAGQDRNGPSIVTNDEVIALEQIGGGAVWAANLFASRDAVLDDGYVPTAGTSVNVADFPPGFVYPQHRTGTIDCAVVLSGEIELGLDGGETTRIGVGGVIVQRNTNHSWRNPLTTDTRVLFVLMCEKPDA
jgi:quercetin dioxygenase-like cupin family protein